MKLPISDPLLFENLYGQKNKARIIALEEDLFKLHMRRSETVFEFLHKVISIRNVLLSAGAKMEEHELVEMVASKLPRSFDVKINTITNNDQINGITLDTLK